MGNHVRNRLKLPCPKPHGFPHGFSYGKPWGFAHGFPCGFPRGLQFMGWESLLLEKKNIIKSLVCALT